MLIDVVAVLVVTMAVVHMVDVVAVRDGLAPVALGMGPRVIGVDRLLRMALVAMNVVDVILVRNCLATITGQVLMVDGFGVSRHRAAPVMSAVSSDSGMKEMYPPALA